MLIAVVLLVASYLFGAVPFGYMIAKAKGVDLFKVGSGNIGATNVGRVLGKKFGILAFALDFLKGAIPVAAVVPLADLIDPTARDAFSHESALRVLAGLLAFLGHMFPVYLLFRGGKGVATGAGVMAVLVPVPFFVALLAWVAITLATRYVSAGSVVAVIALAVARLLETRTPFAFPDWIVTSFCLVGAALVLVKHRANLSRLLAGTENKVGDGMMRQMLLRGLHLLAVGLWFGSGAFFIFVAATPILTAYKEVVNGEPSYRTAGLTIVPPDATEEQKKQLSSALGGVAVAPLFPRFFVLSALCAGVAVATAEGMRRMKRTKIQKWRLWLCVAGAVLVAVGWPLSVYVAELNAQRFDSPEAQKLFNPLHGVSLMGSAITTVVAGVVLLLGAAMPTGGAVSKPHPPVPLSMNGEGVFKRCA
jgi:glycerol-3-phosphate acyltransferase PlsY